MKPVYATLRQHGHSNSGFIDDSLLVSDTFKECKQNVMDTVQIMTELGFIIHQKKSVLQPTKDITFLGNNIHSEDMTVPSPPPPTPSPPPTKSPLFSMYDILLAIYRYAGIY